MFNYKMCVEGFKRTSKECSDWRDEGYEKCNEWGQDCVNWARECVVSWIPIIGPAICKVFEWICRGFQWVCKGAVWIAQWVCHAWRLVTTFVCLVWETVLPIVAIVGIFIKTVLAIPIIGPIIKQIINFVTSLVFGVIGFIFEGLVCGLLGMCLEKKLRLCVIPAHDGTELVVSEADLQPILDRTKQIFKDEANVAVYATVSTDGRAPNVEPGCDGDAWLQDLWLTGSQYEHTASLHCREYSFASIIGIGSPLYAFAVKDVEGKNGCSLWWLTNYIVFEAWKLGQPGTCVGNSHLAHEMGHCIGLLHTSDETNLMYEDCLPTGRANLSPFQKAIVRGSKYVTYF